MTLFVGPDSAWRFAAVAATVLYAAFAVIGGEYCFRNFEASVKGNDGVCRGLMDRRFKTRKGCCVSGGLGYSVALRSTQILTGRRDQKYVCWPCKTLASRRAAGVLPRKSDVSRQASSEVGWSSWGGWSECSETCGGLEGVQRRERFCLAQLMAQCSGDQHELRPCAVKRVCPVDGAWGAWEQWSRCSSTCGQGFSVRLRRCGSVAELNGGKSCAGEASERRKCRSRPCAVGGSWTEWKFTSACSVTCGVGTRTKARLCRNPATRRWGKPCATNEDGGGRVYQELQEQCSLSNCSVENLSHDPAISSSVMNALTYTDLTLGYHKSEDAADIFLTQGDEPLTHWSAWSACAVTCGSGVRVRSRRSQCDGQQLQHGVENCSGAIWETIPCHIQQPCPVDGGWSAYSEYSACHARQCSSEVGTQVRTRSCTNPPPRFGGQPCEGQSIDVRFCYNNSTCKVDGGFCDWQPPGPCLLYQPSNTRMTMRTRSCRCPEPRHGGSQCEGIDYELTPCQDSTPLPSFSRSTETTDASLHTLPGSLSPGSASPQPSCSTSAEKESADAVSGC